MAALGQRSHVITDPVANQKRALALDAYASQLGGHDDDAAVIDDDVVRRARGPEELLFLAPDPRRTRPMAKVIQP